MDNTKKDIFGKTELDRDLAKFSGIYCDFQISEDDYCGKPLTKNVALFSEKHFAGHYCFDHQQQMKGKGDIDMMDMVRMEEENAS